MTEQEFMKLIECLDNIIDMKIENSMMEHLTQHHNVKENDEIIEAAEAEGRHLREVVEWEKD